MKGFFTKNLSLKLISILLAVILWYFVINEKGGETALSIPLDFRNIPSSLIIFKNPVESINIRISGLATLLRGLSPREVKASIDLRCEARGLHIRNPTSGHHPSTGSESNHGESSIHHAEIRHAPQENRPRRGYAGGKTP
ncbi:MAG: hypothetical protein ACE5NJ_06405 [Thermodesulfobacteriota bacterium]